MPRKLRLSVHRKNGYRKKRACTVTTETIWPVSIPLGTVSVYPASLTQCLSQGWKVVSAVDRETILSKTVHGLTYSFHVNHTAFSWCFYLHGIEVKVDAIKLGFPTVVWSLLDVQSLLGKVEACRLCTGHPDDKYHSLVTSKNGGKLLDASGICVAYWDTRFSQRTFRSTGCDMLVTESKNRCSSCDGYRRYLNSMLYRATGKERVDLDRTHPSSHTPFISLTSPEKVERLHRLRSLSRVSQQRIERLKYRLQVLSKKQGVEVDETLHSDLKAIIETHKQQIEEAYPQGSFQQICQQQAQAAAIKKAQSMKWHPLMIRWCIYLRHLSGGAYDMIRDSGVVSLPSQRTLRDYTYYTKACAGFSSEVDRQLMDVANIADCPEREKYVVILMDEMHVKEDIVYDKHTGAIVGFTNLGEVNSHLSEFEASTKDSDDSREPLANSMLVFMVRGLFNDLEFPYAQFPCTSLAGHQMYEMFWEAVSRLERCGFKVLAVVSDGLAANRCFFQLHSPDRTNTDLVYKVPNPYATDDRSLYFISDPPHLMKTVRNCWANCKRHLWCNGKDILWSHLLNLYYKIRAKSGAPGLSLVPKLKYEHVTLTSFSKMRVDLATQVLSQSVANAMKLTGGDEVVETVKFIDKFDKFFDCVNVSSLSGGKLSRNPFKSPYRSPSDFRLKWMEDDFLSYLSKWEKDVEERSGYSDAAKKMMLLSPQTLLGLRMTVHSIIELVKYVFTIPGVKVFMTNRLCQDPLEKFFGQQRQRGRVNENPNVHQFLKNTQALRVVNGVCRDTVKAGNCRGSNNRRRKRTFPADKENMPLPKRRRAHK